jgi:hypothetical protein
MHAGRSGSGAAPGGEDIVAPMACGWCHSGQCTGIEGSVAAGSAGAVTTVVGSIRDPHAVKAQPCRSSRAALTARCSTSNPRAWNTHARQQQARRAVAQIDSGARLVVRT